MLAERSRIVIKEVEQAILEPVVESIDDRELPAWLAAHVDHEIGPHGGAHDHATTGRFVWLDRLAIERDDHRLVILELQPEDARIGGVDQTQAHALAGVYREGL